MMGHPKIYKPDRRRWRPQKVKFIDEFSGVIFESTIPRVRKAMNQATTLLLETNFASLEELYSFLGIVDAVKLFNPNIDLSYSELNNVLGWDIVEGPILNYELKPDLKDDEVIIRIIFDKNPEFWDVTGYINPSAFDDWGYAYQGIPTSSDLYSSIDSWNLPQRFMLMWPFSQLENRKDIAKLSY